MYDLQISDAVAKLLKSPGIQHVRLSLSSRTPTCAVCAVPLAKHHPQTSVALVQDTQHDLTIVRLAHSTCAPSEVRLEDLNDPARRGSGHEWNLVRSAHPALSRVVAWEATPPFERPRRAGTGDAIGRELRRAGFKPVRGCLEDLLVPTVCRLILAKAGRDLILTSYGRRWLEFSGAAGSDASQAWLGDGRAQARALALYGPGLGGGALTEGTVADALASGMVLGATVRLETRQPTKSARHADRTRSSSGRGPRFSRSRGAHGLVNQRSR